MKKILALVLALCMVLALCACGKTAQPSAPEATPAAEPAPAAEPEVIPSVMGKSEGVMDYVEYVTAEMDSEVTSKLSYRPRRAGGTIRPPSMLRTMTVPISFMT